MKKLAVVLFAVATVFGGNLSVAQAGMYVSGNLVAVGLEDSDISGRYGYGNDSELTYETGFGFTAALGYAADNGFRVEGEIGGRFNEMDKLKNAQGSIYFDDGYVSTFSLMANAFYNFMPDQAVSPFIGAGVGLATIEADFDYDRDYYYDDHYYDDDYYYRDYDDSDYDTVLAYQLSAGVSFAVSGNMKIDLQYRYFATDDPDFDGIELDYTTHNAMVGLRYLF